MADWQGGPLAVSAVPCAGNLLAWRQLLPGDRPLPTVCTSSTGCCHFTRSAAANIKAKIRKYLREDFSTSRWVCRSYPPRACTQHCHSPPDLSVAVGQCYINHAKPKSPINPYLRRAVDCHHPRSYSQLLEGRQFDGEETERLRRQSVLQKCCPSWLLVIHEAKALVCCLHHWVS